ncbi:integrase [Streptomyces sp. NPDC002688]|uniref:integrase n=1 Tax=Streptomyces sp. NPDC002688 TaxID=3154423 RepID=UPI0033261443
MPPGAAFTVGGAVFVRPAEEYRTPTEAEWEDFLGHFERRKLSVGTCARAYGTACVHEHACVRCSLLRPDPAQRGRLVEIRDNLLDRIAEAEREGWPCEIEGLRVSLAGATRSKPREGQPTNGTTTPHGAADSARTLSAWPVSSPSSSTRRPQTAVADLARPGPSAPTSIPRCFSSARSTGIRKIGVSRVCE